MESRKNRQTSLQSKDILSKNYFNILKNSYFCNYFSYNFRYNIQPKKKKNGLKCLMNPIKQQIRGPAWKQFSDLMISKTQQSTCTTWNKSTDLKEVVQRKSPLTRYCKCTQERQGSNSVRSYGEDMDNYLPRTHARGLLFKETKWDC